MLASAPSHVAEAVTDKVGDAVGMGRDFVQDVAHTVADRAPDLTSAVGRGARSSLDTVSDALVDIPGQVSKFATKLAALTPFVEAPRPARHRSRWLIRLALVGALVGLGWWLANRRQRDFDAVEASGRGAADTSGLRGEHLATATQ